MGIFNNDGQIARYAGVPSHIDSGACRLLGERAALYRRWVPGSLLTEDGGFGDVSCGQSNPKKPTTMKKSPTNAPQGQGPLGPSSRSLSGIQPVRQTTRRGKAAILTRVAPGCMNKQPRDRITGARPMPSLWRGHKMGETLRESRDIP